MTVAASPRWVGHCVYCRRDDREVETRIQHYAKSLCDACAAGPVRKPSEAGLDAPASSNGNGAKSSPATDAAATARPRPDHAETDMGNARRLVIDHRDRMRYVPGVGWICWDGTRWAHDSDGQAMRFAKNTVRGLDAEVAALFDAAALEPDDAKRQKAQKVAAARLRHAQRSQGQPRLDALLTCASTEKELVAHADDLDADPWLLNTPNGTVDLQTGELREHRPEDLITKITGSELDPDVPTPHWLEYLRTSLADGDLIAAYQRRIGYTLTGDTREQCMFLVAGDGENGKTTGMETIAAMLGDYATAADASTFTTAASDRAARSDLARLRGARLVTADEIDAGATLAESLVKRLTGGDRITARHLYRDEFEFRPVMTLWLTVNHLPAVHGDDHAIWRRLQVIPFETRIQRPDKALSRKLRRELPGILAWALEGCIAWQTDGLGTCPAIERAGGAYRQREDRLALFLDERCEIDAAARITNGDLRDAYHAWEHARGTTPMHDLFDRLAKRGFDTWKSGSQRGRKGLRLASTERRGTGGDG